LLYRAKGHFGHRGVQLSVVVQQLIDPDVSGILFTADPISGHRGMTSIDAGFGLGEALVSGLISADRYEVDRKRRAIVEATPGDKPFAIRSVPGGGTRQEPLPDAKRRARVLDDAQVFALSDIGERIEAQYGGAPQDIEWCIAGGKLYIVQARPITSLFPIPEVSDRGPRIFLSFGHIQMMTDAMPLLASEVWCYFFPTGKGHTPTLADPPQRSPAMVPTAGRLYIDATLPLRAKRPRALVLAGLGYAYADLARSVAVLAARPDFARVHQSALAIGSAALRILGPVIRRVPAALLFTDPSIRAPRVDRALGEYAAAARARIAAAPTPGARIRQGAIEMNALFSQVRRHLSQMVSGVVAHRLLASLAKGAWADGVSEEVDRLLRGLPGNVTTEMDLAVGDLADRVRPHAVLAKLLRERPWPEIRTQLERVEGGPDLAAALETFLARYGDRGAGEIDISRPRWRDDPSLLLRVITGSLSTSSEPGAHRRRFASQTAEGEDAERRLVEAAGRGPLGLLRRWWVRRLCRVARFGMGLREHPKFTIVRVLGLVRSQVVEASTLLLQRGQIADVSQVWQLSLDELARALDGPGQPLDAELEKRELEFRVDQKRKPPLVISSEGETPTLVPDEADIPKGALRGTAASNGVVEGLARVIRDPEKEVLLAGEILVAPFTDPGWTPLFVHAAGVVTEVGGLLTHGAVVAREYGIPAVVSVAGALDRIRTGQRIRVDGTRGFVEILEEP
jgi:pyruvate,water dikinase